MLDQYEEIINNDLQIFPGCLRSVSKLEVADQTYVLLGYYSKKNKAYVESRLRRVNGIVE